MRRRPGKRRPTKPRGVQSITVLIFHVFSLQLIFLIKPGTEPDQRPTETNVILYRELSNYPIEQEGGETKNLNSPPAIDINKEK